MSDLSSSNVAYKIEDFSEKIPAGSSQRKMKSRGIIIAAIEHYERLLIYNIHTLRTQLACNLPIELWQIGQEISDMARAALESRKEEWNLTFKDVRNFTNDPEHWRGYQIKAFILKHTTFDEVILCDCDSLFLQNPEMLFDDPGYKSTGTFFFRDYLKHKPKSEEEEDARIQWFQKLMPRPSPYLPPDCYYLYGLPSNVQQYWFYQESGMVFMNKKRHPKVVDTIFELNKEHKETYKYVHGDKETFWIACLLNNTPFHMNNYPGINLYPDISKPMTYTEKLGPAFTHIYDSNGNIILFYSQKAYPDFSKLTINDILRQLS